MLASPSAIDFVARLNDVDRRVFLPQSPFGNLPVHTSTSWQRHSGLAEYRFAANQVTFSTWPFAATVSSKADNAANVESLKGFRIFWFHSIQ